MAKVVQLRGQSPAGWSKERWIWLRAVTADSRLLPMPRLLATVLAQGFANHETAECRPGLAALMAAIGASRSTTFRALADLERLGWIARIGGEAPGRAASYCFRFPDIERVSPMTPERVSPMTPERVSPMTATGVMEKSPPTPPYKDKPNMNQNTRGNRWSRAATKIVVPGGVRPCPFSRLVQAGTFAESQWDTWLGDRGYRPLSVIGLALGDGLITGWDMPSQYPPNPKDTEGTATAVRFAEWLRAKA